MLMDIGPELMEQHVGQSVLGEGNRCSIAAEKVKDILPCHRPFHRRAKIDGAVSPGIATGQDGCRAGRGEISTGIVGVIDRGAPSKSLEVGRGRPLIAVQRHVAGG